MADSAPDDKVTGGKPDEDWLDDDLEVIEEEPDPDHDDPPADEPGNVDDASDGETAETGEENETALNKLEAEELEMLTEDEAAESLPVDEAEELRQIRREVIALESTAESAGDDEFVCSGCFLVKRMTQLADKRKMLCRDCA